MTLPYIYNPNVPQGSDQINNTQKPINNNFQALFDLIGINHTEFNTPNTFGTHTIVNYFNQTVDPSTASNEIALYSKPVTGDPNILELFYRYPNNGSIFQLTGNSSNGATVSGSGGSYLYPTGIPTNPGNYSWVFGYWQYLSNGVLIKVWETNNLASGGGGYLPYQIPQGSCSSSASGIEIVVPAYTNQIFCSFVSGVYGQVAKVTGTGNFAPSYYSYPNGTNELIVGYNGSASSSSSNTTIPGLFLITVGI